MSEARILQAYAERAGEYTRILGAIGDTHELDRRRIARWAARIRGGVLDAGCGPGHWTDFLHRRGVEITGIDLVPEFIDNARLRYPDVAFRVASLRSLDIADGSLGGVLAWYSLIHLAPQDLPGILAGLARVLAPGGHLLIGFFDGGAVERVDHAVTRAYCWPAGRMVRLLRDVGFDVLDVETRQDPGSRPHAAISAVLR